MKKLVSVISNYSAIKLGVGIFVTLLLSNIAYSLGESIRRFVYILSH